MMPTIHDGDIVAVDDAMFVIRANGGLVVKRLRKRNRHWELVSDNLHYPPRRVEEDDRIVGRVTWTSPQTPAAAVK